MPHSKPALRIGCSGWNYRHWRGAFYPDGLPVKRWFTHYAQTFDTVEINNSFYRLPKAETFDAWREQAPPGFRYAVKANRFITQAKKLKDAREPFARMMAPTRHLREKLGPLLFQLPPSLALNLERLERFLALLPDGICHAFEFRHRSWYEDAVFDLLDRHGAGFVAHDFPGVPSPRLATGRLAYVRFHGAGRKYVGRYSDKALRDWAEWMAAERKNGRAIWAYFNNDIGGDAIQDAQALKAMFD